jgi:hypothetical protein
MEQTVTTAAGVKKRIIAPHFADLAAAVTVAKAEVEAKAPDINDKKFGNKRNKDL